MKSRLLAVCTLLLFAPAIASAHLLSYGTVSTELDVQGSKINLQTQISQNINVFGYPPDQQRMLYQKYFSEYFMLAHGTTTCPFTLTYYDPSFDTSKSLFRGYFACSGPITKPQDLQIHSEVFFDQFQSFDHYMTLTIGTERYSLPFTSRNKDFPGSVRIAPLSNVFDYFLAVTMKFISMGILHIWTGYDHILFLLSVILLARSIKRILYLISSFTVAHSITLILAGLHIVELSPRIVEPAIAATILYVAFRNLQALKGGTDKHEGERVPLTFVFGLIHGLGFASVLQETTIPQIFFVPALLTFNVGIEMGQLAILLVVFPLLKYLDTTMHRHRFFKLFSYLVAALAVFWMLQRIFFW